MFKSSVLLSLIPSLLSSVQATPVPAQDISSRNYPTGPSINVIFFSDKQCTNTVPATIYTRNVTSGVPCYSYPDELYQSVIIDSIDDQFIGTNSALQIGYSEKNTCDDFSTSLKFNIATREYVGQCLFIGIPSAKPGTPLRSGNEYRIASLEG